MVVDEATKAFLEAGSALIVGTVDPDGAPVAGRGWGLTALDGGRMRLLLDAEDEATLANVERAGRIAVTAADVRTLRSIQLKGRAVGIEELESDDQPRFRRYRDAFFADIHETDDTPMELLERFAAVDVVPCTIEVDELFDQTPGPSAGSRMDAT